MTGFPAVLRRVHGDNDDEDEGSGSENVAGNIPGGTRQANLMKAIHEAANATKGPDTRRLQVGTQERSRNARHATETVNLS